MKLSQILRRLQWRARRLFQATADNEPIVVMEQQTPVHPKARAAKEPPIGVRAVFGRALVLAVAFVVTLLLLGALYVWFVAQESRVSLALEGPEAASRASGSSALVAVIGLVEASGQPKDAMVDQDMLLAPTGKRARRAYVQDGVLTSAGRFLEVVQGRLARRDAQLAEAQFALAQGHAEGRDSARTALLAVNDRVARGLLRLDIGDRGFAAGLRAAADALAAEADGLIGVIGASRQQVTPQDVERFFFRGRGVAFGWRQVLQAWVTDAPERVAGARMTRLAPALDALGQAAQFQPTLLHNAVPDSSFQPSHLSHLALLLSQAALRLHRVADET